MTIDARCSVCKNADRRRLIELGWNAGMRQSQLANLFDGISPDAIVKHLKRHADGDGSTRSVDVAPVLPVRERILALQELQLDEIERRIELAKARAKMLNKEHEGEDTWREVDWSDMYDILSKDAQAAISSILKTQGLTDKREAKTADLKLGLFEAMTKSGLAPKAISGVDVAALPEPGGDDEAG